MSKSQFPIVIFHPNGKTEKKSIAEKAFTEKFINQTLQSPFLAHEICATNTWLFVSQKDNEQESSKLNEAATLLWKKAGHPDSLYGTVIQAPDELCQIFFNTVTFVF